MSDREACVQLLATAIYEGFVKPDGGQWLAKTGKIVCIESLRVYKTRKAFAMIRDAVKGIDQKRIWTKSLIRDSLNLMLKERELVIPMTAGFSWEEWLKGQVVSLHDLAQKDRKNQWRCWAMAAENDDNLQTLPYVPEENIAVGILHVMFYNCITV